MLASCWKLHPCELAADFQHEYGIDVWELLDGDIPQRKAEWLAALCANMPSDSRVMRAEDANSSWDDKTWLLWAIEFDLRGIAHSLGAKKGAKKPKPIRTPEEAAKAARVAETAESSRAFVDDVLGKIALRKREGGEADVG